MTTASRPLRSAGALLLSYAAVRACVLAWPVAQAIRAAPASTAVMRASTGVAEPSGKATVASARIATAQTVTLAPGAPVFVSPTLLLRTRPVTPLAIPAVVASSPRTVRALPATLASVAAPAPRQRASSGTDTFEPTLSLVAHDALPSTSLQAMPSSAWHLVAIPDASANPDRHWRVDGSAWISLRGAPSGGGAVPTLGGDQAGVRAYLPLAGRVAATARVGTPLRGTAGADAAIGVAWRGRNGGVIVEQRLALDRGTAGGTAGGTAAIAYAGVSQAPVMGKWRADGYAEGGAVRRGRVLPFVDGSVSLLHPLIAVAGVRAAVGATVAGAAQTGSTRVDIGPDVVLRGVAARHGYRLSLGWRARVAGNAAPGNGPSIGLGMGF